MKETKLKRKLRLWKERKYSNTGYLYIRYFNHPYIDKKIIGADIKLTLWQRIQVLFCGGISIIMSGKDIGGTRKVDYER